MMIDGAVEGPFATHPSIAERIAVLTRLSGDMVPAAPSSRDMRPAPRTDHASGPWGGAVAQPVAVAPARFLVQRVNAGVTENVFGVTPGARRVLVIGMTVMMAVVFWTMFKASRTFPGPNPATRSAPVDVARQMREATGTFSSAGTPSRGTTPRSDAQRLARLDPVEARCFATQSYGVGDRGLRRLHPPDPTLVEAFVSGPEAGSGDIALERYLALKERSLRAVASAQAADLDATLLAYVGTRKSTLWVVHRFFDDAGLRLMQDAYDSPADRAVLGRLRDRLHEGSVALRADGKLAKEIDLLIAAPQEFVPCLARAEAKARAAQPVRSGAP
jgi:hypothetical protein